MVDASDSMVRMGSGVRCSARARKSMVCEQIVRARRVEVS
jgi:hypothetical protein